MLRPHVAGLNPANGEDGKRAMSGPLFHKVDCVMLKVVDLDAALGLCARASRAPPTKETLRAEFEGVSGRAFDKLFTQAVRETGAAAWSKGGRRPRQPR